MMEMGGLPAVGTQVKMTSLSVDRGKHLPPAEEVGVVGGLIVAGVVGGAAVVGGVLVVGGAAVVGGAEVVGGVLVVGEV